MAVSNQQWVLFGYDLRKLWRSYTRAWQDVFWRYDAHLRQLIDEPVLVLRSGDTIEPSDTTATEAGKNQACAQLLPDEFVLVRTLTLPRSAAVDLDAVTELEISSSSPFPTADTASGWKLLHARGATVTLVLAIVSKSAVMNYLHRKNPDAHLDTMEVWAEYQGQPIVLSGFGEAHRNQRYLSRLRNLAIMCGFCIVGVVAIALIPVVYKSYELKALQEEYDDASRQARSVIAIRSDLARTNQLIQQVNTLAVNSAKPVVPLGILTREIPDNTFLMGYKQQGLVIELDGSGENAAELMQQLSENPVFVEVKPTSAIRAVGQGGAERFRLELTLSDDVAVFDKVDTPDEVTASDEAAIL